MRSKKNHEKNDSEMKRQQIGTQWKDKWKRENK